MRFFFLFLSYFSFSLVASSQDTLNDTSEQHIQVQILDSVKAIYLTRRFDSSINKMSYEISIRNHHSKVYERFSLNDIAFSTGNEIENISIQFTSEKIGFIYGNETGYGFWPFLFKTTNGGKSWQRIIFKKGESGPPMRKDDFFMFDSKRGILISNWHGEKTFNYYLTSNGGKSWKEMSFAINNEKIRVINADPFMNTVYSKEGIVTTILTTRNFDFFRENLVVVLRSEDFGHHFHVMK